MGGRGGMKLFSFSWRFSNFRYSVCVSALWKTWVGRSEMAPSEISLFLNLRDIMWKDMVRGHLVCLIIYFLLWLCIFLSSKESLWWYDFLCKYGREFTWWLFSFRFPQDHLQNVGFFIWKTVFSGRERGPTMWVWWLVFLRINTSLKCDFLYSKDIICW